MIRLGADLAAGERPQAAVPAGAWQAAESLGDWTLVGCTVAPGFGSWVRAGSGGWSPAFGRSTNQVLGGEQPAAGDQRGRERERDAGRRVAGEHQEQVERIGAA